MNNVTFGDAAFGYYETIAGVCAHRVGCVRELCERATLPRSFGTGGAGAGPHWHGRSGVHTHMTNTRITDPEVLERRYPVILRTFALRSGAPGRSALWGTTLKLSLGDNGARRVRWQRAAPRR